nr:Chain B, LxxLL motif peptide [synthetic construct]
SSRGLLWDLLTKDSRSGSGK